MMISNKWQLQGKTAFNQTLMCEYLFISPFHTRFSAEWKQTVIPWS